MHHWEKLSLEVADSKQENKAQNSPQQSTEQPPGCTGGGWACQPGLGAQNKRKMRVSEASGAAEILRELEQCSENQEKASCTRAESRVKRQNGHLCSHAAQQRVSGGH